MARFCPYGFEAPTFTPILQDRLEEAIKLLPYASHFSLRDTGNPLLIGDDLECAHSDLFHVKLWRDVMAVLESAWDEERALRLRLGIPESTPRSVWSGGYVDIDERVARRHPVPEPTRMDIPGRVAKATGKPGTVSPTRY